MGAAGTVAVAVVVAALALAAPAAGAAAGWERVAACRTTAATKAERCECAITGLCGRCSALEMAQHADEHLAEWCHEYGMKQPILCTMVESGEQFSTFQSCSRIPAEERQAFFKFEVICAVVAVLSVTAVMFRRKQLHLRVQHKLKQRVHTSL